MGDQKTKKQEDFWLTMMSKYEERNIQLDARRCDIQHHLEAMSSSMPAALMYSMSKSRRSAGGRQPDIMEFMANAGRPANCECGAESKSRNQNLSGTASGKQSKQPDMCECAPCENRGSKMNVAAGSPPGKEDDDECNCISCTCDPCNSKKKAGPTPFTVEGNDECNCISCNCDPCNSKKKAGPIAFTVEGNNECDCIRCKCDPCRSKKPSADDCQCSPCENRPSPGVIPESDRCDCPICSCSPCADTSRQGATPAASECTQCLEQGGIPDTSSIFSLQSTDLLYMSKLQEIAIKERQMKQQIQEMEHREQAYLETIRQADEMWACMEGCYKQRLSDVEQHGDSVRQKFEKMNEQLMEENKRLADELKDAKLELKQCMERVQGPINRQLDKERRKSEQLEDELKATSRNLADRECCYMQEKNDLQNKLNCSCRNVLNLKNENDQLKRQVCSLQCKYKELQKDLIQQKLSEAHTLQRLNEALCTEGKGTDGLTECDCTNGEDDTLYGIARRLSKTLTAIEECYECKKIPSNLKSTAEGVKDLADLVDKHAEKDDENECTCKCCPCICKGKKSGKDDNQPKGPPPGGPPPPPGGSGSGGDGSGEGDDSPPGDAAGEEPPSDAPPEPPASEEPPPEEPPPEEPPPEGPPSEESPSDAPEPLSASRRQLVDIETETISLKESDEKVSRKPSKSFKRGSGEEICSAEGKEGEILTKVETAGGVGVDFDNEVNLYKTVSDGINITTTVTGSGMLEIITEGPAGVIETTMTYTLSGNIELVTDITEYSEEHSLRALEEGVCMPILPKSLNSDSNIPAYNMPPYTGLTSETSSSILQIRGPTAVISEISAETSTDSKISEFDSSSLKQFTGDISQASSLVGATVLKTPQESTPVFEEKHSAEKIRTFKDAEPHIVLPKVKYKTKLQELQDVDVIRTGSRAKIDDAEELRRGMIETLHLANAEVMDALDQASKDVCEILENASQDLETALAEALEDPSLNFQTPELPPSITGSILNAKESKLSRESLYSILSTGESIDTSFISEIPNTASTENRRNNRSLKIDKGKRIDRIKEEILKSPIFTASLVPYYVLNVSVDQGTPRSSKSRIPIPVQRLSKSSNKTCECKKCECRVCSPEIMKQREKAGFDCPCRTNCKCEVCSSNAVSGACGEHPPDCDCPQCLCKPCGTMPPRDYQIRVHPPNCDCLTCLCDPCGDCSDEACEEVVTVCKDCDCDVCTCATCPEKKSRAASLRASREESRRKEAPSKTKHHEGCDCLICRCISHPEPVINECKALFPPDICKCEECFCPQGIPPVTVEPSLPPVVTPELPVKEEQELGDDPATHPPDCACLECLLLCDARSGLPESTPEPEPESEPEPEPEPEPSKEMSVMSDNTLTNKIAEMGDESVEREKEIKELQEVVQQIQCACHEAELRASATNLSGLQIALATLKEQFREKDRLMKAMVRELRGRGVTNFSDVCGRCDHPDYPNCPCHVQLQKAAQKLAEEERPLPDDKPTAEPVDEPDDKPGDVPQNIEDELTIIDLEPHEAEEPETEETEEPETEETEEPKTDETEESKTETEEPETEEAVQTETQNVEESEVQKDEKPQPVCGKGVETCRHPDYPNCSCTIKKATPISPKEPCPRSDGTCPCPSPKKRIPCPTPDGRCPCPQPSKNVCACGAPKSEAKKGQDESQNEQIAPRSETKEDQDESQSEQIAPKSETKEDQDESQNEQIAPISETKEDQDESQNEQIVMTAIINASASPFIPKSYLTSRAFRLPEVNTPDWCQDIFEDASDDLSFDCAPLEITEIRPLSGNCLIVKWTSPTIDHVKGYEIEVDGVVKSRVRSASRTSAVLETHKLKEAVSISIFVITNNGRFQPAARAIYQV